MSDQTIVQWMLNERCFNHSQLVKLFDFDDGCVQRITNLLNSYGFKLETDHQVNDVAYKIYYSSGDLASIPMKHCHYPIKNAQSILVDVVNENSEASQMNRCDSKAFSDVYLEEKSGRLKLTDYALSELNDYLLTLYPHLQRCVMCSQLVIDKIECPSCHQVFHERCLSAFGLLENCPQCSSVAMRPS